MSAATASGAARSGRIPVPFAALGAGGLVPFVACVAFAWFGPEADRGVVLYWLSGYAMVILAFVGALHWGIVMMVPSASSREQWLGAAWSVMPALAGWTSLMLPAPIGLRAMAVMFVGQYVMDRGIAARHRVPAWFLPLRLRLTLVVAPALAAASFA